MLERLQVQAVSDQHYLEECLDVFGAVADEENNTTTYNNPVIDKVLEESGIGGFRTLTNFTPAEFDTRTWEKHGVDFGMKALTPEKMIMRVIDIASPVLYGGLVTMPSTAFLRDQALPPPSGRFGEQEHCFSGKHKLYGLKIEASVSPQGFMVDMSSHQPGSVADMTMFRNRHDVHVDALTKKPDEVMVNDNGEQFQPHPTLWAVLVDMGYVGLSHTIRAIHPKKRPVQGTLDRQDLERNAAVSSDRVSLNTFVWDVKFYDGIQRLTFTLTNFHVGLMPLHTAHITTVLDPAPFCAKARRTFGH
ncbi:hypothetical protein H310_09651 [Aphanomyces invadans]|uniref:DDE Tnp4 domain-containing protein n=1 Tax=Aphanomyces invadans TaxID=157072 RepID=A0A024TTD5_9STRA|nr:hypothetical protein H310_09651 [Aphanomyces invadans]ETV97303.1 hypothetical protein H310_09651 [Aphanomyces invadans]|eukprot:XP_008874011.1 hypothetical protein H310_09651 [Aphanomyces invadans]